VGLEGFALERVGDQKTTLTQEEAALFEWARVWCWRIRLGEGGGAQKDERETVLLKSAKVGREGKGCGRMDRTGRDVTERGGEGRGCK